MVVNCLPLFIPRPETQQGAVDSATGGSESVLKENRGKVETEDASMHESMHNPRKQERRQTKAMRRFVLKKASSAENLLNAASPDSKISDQKKRCSEAEDILDANTRSGVKVQRNMWTHFNSSPPTSSKAVHLDVVATALTIEGDNDDTEVEKGGVVVGTVEGEEVDMGDGGDEDKGRGSIPQSSSDGGSDGEESKEMRVSYINNPEQMETLKRSSGSVSFIGRASPFLRVSTSPPPPSLAEDVTEGSEEKEEAVAVVHSGPSVQEVNGEEGKGEAREGGEVAMVGSEGGDCTDGAAEKVEATGDEVAEKNGETESEGDIPKQKLDVDKAELGPQPQEAAGGVSEKAELIQSTPVAPSAPPQASPNPVPPTLAPHNLVPLTLAPPVQAVQQLTPTPLPPAPMTFEPEFIERSGWLMKLSHRRGK